MDLYLAGIYGRRKTVDLYLAGNTYDVKSKCKSDVAILESFYYADEQTEQMIPKLKKFLLDSGAFTFFGSGKKVKWNEYLDKYIDFINRNNVKRFFELDIDCLIGYEEVLKLREKLERGTGGKCIPVWHKSRGKEEFLKMCEEYNYVAIGGIVSKEIRSAAYKYFPWFINEAHKREAKIHALGFTNLKGIEKYHFDSVDSTSWTAGSRFGKIYKFNGKTMIPYPKQKGKRISDSKKAEEHNFKEWVKFQKYAEKHL